MSNDYYHVLAYYLFARIEDPRGEVLRHQQFLQDKDIRCRVYISEEGINGQMSASPKDAELYREWLSSQPCFQGVVFKVHTYPGHVFPRMTVKYRRQIVALDEEVDIAQTGEHLSPQEWKEMLDKRDEKTLLIDVRNDYEWKIGHFEGAELPQLESFREFPAYARQLKEQCDPKETKVMMYCTGGIRCELYSALMKKVGFDKVYQLEGGVINYGQQEGQEHWRGKLFVFDDRLAVPIAEEGEEEVISSCHQCDAASDVYYNCANVDCNALFLSCPECAAEWKGCCSQACTEAPRLRAFVPQERPKPFRRQHLCCSL